MSRRALLVAALCAVVAAAPLGAQRRPDPDPVGTQLLARAESLSRREQTLDSVQREAVADRRRGQVYRAGKLTLVLYNSVSSQLGQRVAARADSILEAFGGRLPSWLESVIIFEQGTSDSNRVLGAIGRGHRRTVSVGWNWSSPSDTAATAQLIADEVSWEFRATLHETWKAWMPGNFVIWLPRFEAVRALGALTEPRVSSGSGCLAGLIGECRLWLGLDHTDRPFATRYRVSDVRAYLKSYPTSFRGELVDACIGGDDVACVRYVESRRVLDPIPSPPIARQSLMRAVWALHGAPALERAMADTSGAIGERFALAAGVSEDSLLTEWRAWTLGRGRTDRLAATLPQSLSVLFAALLVVFFATRSGRWR